jgi:hypothetical protein
LGVVESRVSQIHASGVVRLRAALRDLAAGGNESSRTKAKRHASPDARRNDR